MGTAEHARLAEATGAAEDDLFEANPWYEWGPYLSERAWGTVREDYSDGGDAWGYFPHDQARSRAYRWKEDGMAGLSDVHHDLCLGLALWNGEDRQLEQVMDAHRAQTEYIKSVAGTASTGAADQIASACSGAAAMLAGGFWFIGKRDLRRWIGLAVVVIAVVLVVDTFLRPTSSCWR